VPTRASQPPTNPSSLGRSTQSNLRQSPNRPIQDCFDAIDLGNGSSGDAVAILESIELKKVSQPSPAQSRADAFLVADQSGLTAIYAMDGIIQPYAFMASKPDSDTLSNNEAMPDVDHKLWIEAPT